jgi:hypothetical protein
MHRDTAMNRPKETSSIFCMTRYQCRQLFGSRRWLLVLALDVFLVVAAIIDLKTRTFYILTKSHLAVPPNVWDVPFNVCASNYMTISILVVMFVFLTGDALLRDERSGRLPMLICRTQNRATWFVSLIPAIALAAVAFVAVAVLISLGAALLVLPAGRSFSPFLTSTIHAVVSLRGSTFLPGTPPSPPLFFLGVVGYLALALCCVALSSVVISLWWRRTLSALVPVAWILFVDGSIRGRLLQRGGGYERYTFFEHLAFTSHWKWGDHPTIVELYPFPVAASIIAFCTLVVLWSVAGFISFRQADL